ncbi:MAG: CDP-alcohol phosphatidyltransferase family protein [Nitrospirae bacterium]|nr:CDP-alcohol phosphatidyltransferase family protein [Nitrospirota bacterium]
MKVGNLPNILTISRILLLPFFATTLIYGEYLFSMILFFAASATDVLDGMIARKKKQMTAFGSIMDPVADKFLMITSFVIMSVYGWIPKWLTITVISKDLIIVTGWLILYFVKHNTNVEPTILGKAANFFQILLIGIVLVSINTKDGFLIPEIFPVTVAIVTALSGILYIYEGLKIAHSENA